MRRITIKRVSTWHYKKMRPCTEQSNDLAPLSPFRSWLGCITNTFGYDFRKGHRADVEPQIVADSKETANCPMSASPARQCWPFLFRQKIPTRPPHLIGGVGGDRPGGETRSVGAISPIQCRRRRNRV